MVVIFKESVFERLSSPRNYTGIHKAKLEEKAKSPRKQDENKQDTLSPRPNPTQSTSGVRPVNFPLPFYLTKR